jgi:hypothetical protein
MDEMQVPILGKPLGSYEYRYTPKLCVITPYYNPVGYETRWRNYQLFMRLMRESGIRTITVECAFGDQQFSLPDSPDVIKIRGKSLLWQKERLINLVLPWLPRSCEYVAWIDCDLIFLDSDWAKKTVTALETHPIVQVFDTCHQLPQHFARAENRGQLCTSFAHIVCGNRSVLKTGRYEDHGHPGYGWAARRDVLERHGLYEYAIAGSADHYMAHAAVGDLDSPCIAKMMFNRPAPMQCFREWAEKFDVTVGGNLGVIHGEVLHLWHGEPKDRKYYLRQLELAELEFNPTADLIALPGKPLELMPGRHDLEAFLAAYFVQRREDGPTQIAA